MIDDLFDIVNSMTFEPPKFIARRLKPATWKKALVHVLWNIFVFLVVVVGIIAGFVIYDKLT